MARLARLSVPGHPHRVILRGNNGQPVVLDDEDRRLYLDLLKQAASAEGVAVHAYVLLDNRVELLATPAGPEGLSRMMQALGRRYVGTFNRRHGRSGTLWEGRFRAGVIESERLFITSACEIELSPVRAGHVSRAQDWPWSSARHHLGQARDPVITDHPAYWSLGNTPFERELAYRSALDHWSSIAPEPGLVEAALKCWVAGSDAFVARLAQAVDRPLRPRPRGRPRRKNRP